MGYFPVRYDSRVIINDRRGFIRLATVPPFDLQKISSVWMVPHRQPVWSDWEFFSKSLVKKFRAILAQIYDDFGYFGKHALSAETAVATFWTIFWKILATFYFCIWSHCLPSTTAAAAAMVMNLVSKSEQIFEINQSWLTTNSYLAPSTF